MFVLKLEIRKTLKYLISNRSLNTLVVFPKVYMPKLNLISEISGITSIDINASEPYP